MLNDRDQGPRLVVGSAIGRRGYEQARLLGVHRDARLARQADSYCMGTRQFGRPMMAMTVQKQLGPVRHALSQMVVAGTMVTQPPIEIHHGLRHPTSPSGGDGDAGE